MSDVKIKVVTTMNRDGYNVYGKGMIESWVKHWPNDITLDVYAEGFSIEKYDNVNELDLNASCPDLVEFKKRNSGREDQQNPNELHLGAVRFSHKVYAVIHACNNNPDSIVIWLDADTLTYADISKEFLMSFVKEGAYTSYLGREGNYSECGFVVYDTRRTKENKVFMDSWKHLYDSDELFKLPQWHDSFVYDVIRTTLEENAIIKSHNITPNGKGYDHVFINSPLGKYLDHLKGPRKAEGKSRKEDLYTDKQENSEWSYY